MISDEEDLTFHIETLSSEIVMNYCNQSEQNQLRSIEENRALRESYDLDSKVEWKGRRKHVCFEV